MIDDLITECTSRGWYLNNLYQHTPSTWCCNLRTDTHFTAFGRGPTALIALDAAMSAIEDAEPFPEQPTCVNQAIYNLEGANRPQISIKAMLDAVTNLRPKANPFQGRKL